MTQDIEKPRGWWDYIAVVARWVVGVLFIYMGLKKALHPYDFLTLIDEYEMISTTVVMNSIAAFLPWFEVFCGLLLLTGIAVRGTALMLIAMLIPFTLAVLKRAVAIAGTENIAFCAVKFDCGCGAGVVFICPKLLENGLLILIAFWLLAGVGRKFSLRFNLLPGR